MPEKNTWFLTDGYGGRTRLPPCSADYMPSSKLFSACLEDPDGSVCRRHRQFFRNRKVANASQ